MIFDKELFEQLAKEAVGASRPRKAYDLRDSEDEVASVRIEVGSHTPGVIVEIGRYHSFEATDELEVACGVKTSCFQPMKDEDIIKK